MTADFFLYFLLSGALVINTWRKDPVSTDIMLKSHLTFNHLNLQTSGDNERFC